MLMMRGWGANLGQVRRIGSSCFTFLGSIPTDAHDAGAAADSTNVGQVQRSGRS